MSPSGAVGPRRPATENPKACNLRPPEMRNIRPALTSREDALVWAARIANACRCAQEVREIMFDAES